MTDEADPAPASRTLADLLQVARGVADGSKFTKTESIAFMRDLLGALPPGAVPAQPDPEPEHVAKIDALYAALEARDAECRELRLKQGRVIPVQDPAIAAPGWSGKVVETRLTAATLASVTNLGMTRARCPVAVEVTDTLAVHLPREANRYYTAEEALGLIDELQVAVASIAAGRAAREKR